VVLSCCSNIFFALDTATESHARHQRRLTDEVQQMLQSFERASAAFDTRKISGTRALAQHTVSRVVDNGSQKILGHRTSSPFTSLVSHEGGGR